VEQPSDSRKCSITIVASGGGAALLNLNWGSHNAAENTLIRKIKLLVDKELEP